VSVASTAQGPTGGDIFINGFAASEVFDRDNGNNNRTYQVEVVVIADIRVTKSGVLSVTAGAPVQTGDRVTVYEMVVSNAGPSQAYGVYMADFVPLVLNIESAGTEQGDCVIDRTRNLVNCSIGDIAANRGSGSGETAVKLNITYTTPASTPPTVFFPSQAPGPNPVINNAQIGSISRDDKEFDNIDPHGIGIVAEADIWVRKTCPPGPIISGTTTDFQYVITLGNRGPSNARDVNVTDQIPSQFIVQNTTPTVTGDVSCRPIVNNLLFCEANSDFTPNGDNAAATITVTVRVRDDILVEQQATNTVTIESSTYQTTPSQADNVFQCGTLIQPPPDLTIQKTGPAQILINDSEERFFYSIQVINNGPTVAQAVGMRDLNISSLFVVRKSEIVITGGPGTYSYADNCQRFSPGPNDVTCEFGELTFPETNVITVVIPFTVPATTIAPESDVRNCARVFAQLDRDPNNNVDCHDISLTNGAAISVTKTSPNVCAGNTGTYSVTVFNNGPAGAENTMVSDLLEAPYTPSGLPAATLNDQPITCTGGWLGNQLTLNCGTVPNQGTLVVTFGYSVGAAERKQTVSNTVQVQTTVFQNNTEDDTFTTSNEVLECASVTSVKSGTATVVSGQSAGPSGSYQYEIVVSNAGPTFAENVEISDLLPQFLTATSAVTNEGRPCNISSVGGRSLVECDWPGVQSSLADLTATILFSVSDDAPAGPVENCVTTTTTTDGTVIPEACFTTVVTTSADIVVLKETSLDCITAGEGEGSFVIRVNNRGPSLGYDVKLSDAIPQEFVYVLNSLSVTGPQVTASTDCRVEAGLLSCDLNNLTPTSLGQPDAVVVSFRVGVPSFHRANPGIVNTAVVSSGCSVACVRNSADPNLANNEDNATKCIVARADLSIQKDCLATPELVSGKPGPFFFTLSVNNAGPSFAYNVEVRDPLPEGLVPAGMATGAGVDCDPFEGSLLVCNIETFADNGPTVTILVPFRPVAGLLEERTVTNTAFVDSDTDDSTLPNNSSCQIKLVPPPDFTITKTGPSEIIVDQSTDEYTYTMTITNNGPTSGEGVTFNDTVPGPFVVLPARTVLSGGDGSKTFANSCASLSAGNRIECDFGTLPFYGDARDTITITVIFTVPAGTLDDMVQNCAIVAAQLETNTTNNEACFVTTLQAGANLMVMKTTPDSCIGTRAEYEIEVQNMGPAPARTATLWDQLPSQFSEGRFERATRNGVNDPSIVCDFDNTGNLTCNFGLMAVGDDIFVYFSYLIPASLRPAPVENTVHVTSTTVDLMPVDNMFTHTSNHFLCFNIVSGKQGPATVTAGLDGYQYVLSVTNTGPSEADSVTFRDVMPDVSFRIRDDLLPAECSTGDDVSGRQFVTCTWSNGLFAVQRTETVTVTFDVREDGVARTNVRNCVEATPGATQTDGTNVACNVTQIITVADVAIEKSGPLDCIEAGRGSGFFSLVATNWGPSRAYGVVLRDLVPSPLVVGSISTIPDGVACTTTLNADSSTLIRCVPGDMAPRATVSVSYDVTVPASARDSVVDNTVVIESSCSTSSCPGVNSQDPFLGNNTATWSTEICAFDSVTVVKSVSNAPYVAGAGGTHTFSLEVANGGPSVAYDVLVKDLGFDGGRIETIQSANGQGVCSLEYLNCTYASLDNGASDTITLTFVIDSDQLCGVYPNTATIESSTNSRPPPQPSTIDVPVTAEHDLSITKQGVEVAIPGGAPGHFYVDFGNDGPSDANNVTFVDLVPEQLTVTGVSTNFSNPDACGFSGQNINCFFPMIPAHSWVQVNYTYMVASDAPLPPINPATGEREVKNTACVNSINVQSCETEINVANNCDDFFTEILCVADLMVTKDDGVNTPILAGGGGEFTYTMTVSNLGPSQAQTVSLTDVWPSQYTKIGAPVTSNNDTSCEVLINGNIQCTLPPLLLDETRTIMQKYEVRSNVAFGFYTNRVTVSGSCQDPNPANNVATDTNEVINRADLGIIKSDCVSEVVAGGMSQHFTFVVSNDGPSDGIDVTVTDTIPAVYDIEGQDLTFWGSVAAPSCVWTDRTFVCTYASFPVGETAQIGLVYKVKADVLPNPAVINCAVVGTTSQVTDDNPSNDEDCDCNAIITRADLEVIKTVTYPTDPDCVVAGDDAPATFVVTVRNLGESYARNVVMNEEFPEGVRILVAPAGCVAQGDNKYECVIGDMGPRTELQFPFTFDMAPSTPAGVVTNFASVESTTVGTVLATFDPELCNNNVTLPVLVCVKSDLEVHKDDGVTVTTAGAVTAPGVPQMFKYNITGKNNGPSDARNVVITDVWPLAEAGYHRAEIKGATNCRDTAQGFVCEFENLAVGETFEICVFYTVDACAIACEACNSVLIASDSVDTVADNNLAKDCNDVRTEADLKVCKDDGVTEVTAGDGIVRTYTMEVCNEGPSCAEKVTLLDHWPEQVTLVPGSIEILGGRPGSCLMDADGQGNFSCTLLTLEPQQCITVVASYEVPATTETCSLHNTATVGSITFDPDLCNNVDHDTNALVERAELTVTKTASDTVIAIDDYSPKAFTISVYNDGPSTARDVIVTDIWPMTLCQYPERITTSQGTWLSTGADVMATLNDIAPKATATIVIPFSVCNRTHPGDITNRVNAFSPTDEVCRDGDKTLVIQGVEQVREEPAAATAEEPAAIFDVEPVRKHVAKETVAKSQGDIAVDISLVPMHAQLEVQKVGDAKYSVRVKNILDKTLHINDLVATGKADGKMVSIDLTTTGPWVKASSCQSLVHRALPASWSQSCIVELKQPLDLSKIKIAGGVRKSDGVHPVFASTKL
jgi:uncharacterized repeat protein (TIGR01451 family)